MLSLFLMGFMNLVTWWKTCCLILLIVIFFSYSNWTPLRTADCICQQRNTTGKSYLKYYFLLNVYVLRITARGQDNQFGKLLKTLNIVVLFHLFALFCFCGAGGGSQGFTHARQVLWTKLYFWPLMHIQTVRNASCIYN